MIDKKLSLVLLWMFLYQFVHCLASDDKNGKCTGGEIQIDCAGSCEPTCQDLNKTCSTDCKQGCGCPKGRVRRKEGQPCIDPYWCEKINAFTEDCPKDMMVTPCTLPCEPTCTNMDPGICETYDCKPGCACRPGFVRKDELTSDCVPVETCRPAANTTETCGENEAFNECGPSCPDTCDGQVEYRNCSSECERGCFCVNGTVLDITTQKCVPKDSCPKVCSEDEEFNSCGPSCPDTCSKDEESDKICTDNCVPGCFCKKGLVRDVYSGKCFAPDKCPNKVCQKDDPNSEYVSCKGCPATCKTWFQKEACTKSCERGCRCKYGYVLDDDGKCISLADCFSDKNQETTTSQTQAVLPSHKLNKTIQFNIQGFVSYNRHHHHKRNHKHKRDHKHKRNHKRNKHHHRHNKKHHAEEN